MLQNAPDRQSTLPGLQASAAAVSVAAELLSLNVLSSGWGRATVAPIDGSAQLSLIGNALADLTVGHTYEFVGVLKNHATYGPQLDVQSALNFVPSDPIEIRKLLIRCFKNVGDANARKLVALHQERKTLATLRDQLIRNPYQIDFTEVTSLLVEFTAVNDVPAMVERLFALHLLGIERMSPRVVKSLATRYTSVPQPEHGSLLDPIQQAWDHFAANPYAPVRDTEGYGFPTADAIARTLKIASDSAYRLAALTTYALDEGCAREGNTYLRKRELAQAISLVDPRVTVDQAVAAALASGEPIHLETSSAGEQRYYPTPLFLAEKRVAASLAARMRVCPPMLDLSRDELGRLIRDAEKGMGFSLDPSQQQAVLAILSSTRTVHTVTAGPGCGKTAIMEVVVQVLAARNTRSTDYGFAAPTGKAAKVLGARIARINATARTIHATLGVNEDGFEHNANNLLGFKVLVIDESSMLDLLLLDALLQATPMDTHLVLLGDTQQLPSVSPGNCLADLLSLPFDHHRLSKVHRNQGGILEVVNRAAVGESDTANREDVRFIPELPEATEQTVDAVITYYAKAAEGLEGGLASVCLLVARRKGKSDTPGWNTTYLNQRLRERFNPDGLKVPGAPLRVGDRIIIRKNILIRIPDEKGDKFRQVVNGDTGSIERVATRSDTGRLEHLVLALDDGTRVPFPAEHLANLDLAYAMTVHSAQGSEYRRVVFLCINGSPSFVHRGIVFTAYSRARAHLTVIGNPSVLANILRRPQPARLSGLVERVTALQLISN